jgi:hypothetical protein
LRQAAALPGVSLTDDQVAKIGALVAENKIKEAQEEILNAFDEWVSYVENQRV